MSAAPREPMPRWLLALICAVGAVVLLPFAPWIVLALWFGGSASGVHRRLVRVLRGRSGLAATITVLLGVVLAVPIAILMTSILLEAIDLVRGLAASEEGTSFLERLALGPGDGNGDSSGARELTSTQGIADLIVSQGGRAWEMFKQVAGAAVHAVIGLFILITGMYGVLVEGPTWYAWFERHAPIPAASLQRIADAFTETGRGLAVGIVGAGLIQSVIATVAYFVLGVPQALALGMLTLIFSVVPAVGTAVVWVPVAAGLYLTGQEGAALVLAVIGLGVIGTVDNIARPYLARRGRLALPTWLVLLAMFGGIELIGAWGLVLGPLVVRLAKEVILIRSESNSQPEAPPADLATPDAS